MASNSGSPRVLAAASSLLGLLAVGIAVSWADGGHLSTDSIQQMFEAGTGRSVSWAQPLMSAILNLLGGGDAFSAHRAAMAFVVLVCLLTWGAIGLIVGSAEPRSGIYWRLPILALVVLNPVLLSYAGIVWKDVLFTSAIFAGIALGLLALASRSPVSRIFSSILAMVVLAFLPGIRQHGIFVAPMLAALPLLAIFWLDEWAPWRRWTSALFLVFLGVFANVSLDLWSRARVVGDPDLSADVGFRSIYAFDLTGIERRLDVGPLRAIGFSESADRQLDGAYTPDRIDFFDRAPLVSGFFGGVSTEQLGGAWREALVDHPLEYAKHRLRVFQRLLGIGEGGVCLPVHLGVSGIPSQVHALGLRDELDRHDAWVYATVQPLFPTPVFAHWAYALALVAAMVIAFAVPWRTRVVVWVIGASGVAYLASFALTAIACDFRYLLPVVAFASIMVVVLACGWRERKELHLGGADGNN